MRKVLTYTLIISLISSMSWAQTSAMERMGMTSGYSGNEYFVGRIQGKPLITVYLLSGVRTPGVYHIPVQTDLGELLSYAGGISDLADVTDISIRTRTEKTPVMKHYDLESIVSNNKPLPSLLENDTIHIPARVDHTQKTLLYVSILSAIASIALTAYIINKDK